MPQLRKRSAVVYKDKDDDDDDEDEEIKHFSAPAAKRRKRKPVTLQDDDGEWEEPEGAKTRQKPARKVRKKAANNIKPEPTELLLSDSGCDSEPEVKVKAKVRRPKAKRARKTKEPEVSPYFDWSPMLDSKATKAAPETKQKSAKNDDEEEDTSEEDWEEVGSAGGDASKAGGDDDMWEEGTKTLEICLDDEPKKRVRRGADADAEAEFRRAWQKHRREMQHDMHLVHLLCLLAHGQRLSGWRFCGNKLIRALALSMMPADLLPSASAIIDAKSAKRHVELILEFAAQRMGLDRRGSGSESCADLRRRLLLLLQGENTEEEKSRKMKVMATCVLIRAAGFDTRLVHALQPVPLKPPKEDKKKNGQKPKKKKTKKKTEKRVSSDSDFDSKPSRPMLSEEEEEEEELTSPCVTSWWLEVLCGDRWVTVDCERRLVDCADQMERPEHREGPLYVIAFAEDSSYKDVTARYAKRWCTTTRKARLPKEEWEGNVMLGFQSSNRLLDAKEDDDIREHLLGLPVPKSTGDYNNHPLYALTRHLKKYEVIYPPDAQPLHFHKGEPAYPRENVLLCHTRETWLKEARVVRLGEEPVKVVDSRMSNKQRVLGNSKPLKNELFGRWQTEEYDPPAAEDGVVPKNEHGNVYLFKPCMLPKGCVHLRLNGLARIGRRLGVDMAQAMIGWEFHGGGWAHPVMDGWVVCKEHASAVRLAWLEQERESARKVAAKREARAFANWRLLTKALLIRERLKARYDTKGEATFVSSIAEGMKEKPA